MDHHTDLPDFSLTSLLSDEFGDDVMNKEDKSKEVNIEFLGFVEQLIREMSTKIEKSKFDAIMCKRIICLILSSHYWTNYNE